MTHPTYHYYEPSQGHGLPHDPLNAIVGPRPIGWISSRGSDGTVNLAPYSFFNAFNYHPPIIGFSSTTAKDSLRNVRETGEFVWNLATRDLAERMNRTCAAVPYGVNEFELGGLTAIASRLVDVPRVAESGVNFIADDRARAGRTSPRAHAYESQWVSTSSSTAAPVTTAVVDPDHTLSGSIS